MDQKNDNNASEMKPYNQNTGEGRSNYGDQGKGNYSDGRSGQGDQGRSEGRNYNDQNRGESRPYGDQNRGNYGERRSNYGDQNRGGYGERRPYNSGGGRPPSKFNKSSPRQKTETQNFIMWGEEKIETLFPVPVNVSLPSFQRSLGMAEGTILEANEKGNGVVEIEGVKYPMKENRTPVMQKRYPLSKYVGKTLKFTFYPTITLKGMKILKLEANDPPFIKISNFRKELPKQGFIEAIGTVKFISNDHFTISIWSGIAKKEYIVNIFGNCTAKIGELVKVDSVLKDGLIQMETIKLLTPKR